MNTMNIELEKLEANPTIVNYSSLAQAMENDESEYRKLKIGILRNFTLDPLTLALPIQLVARGFSAETILYEDYQLDELILNKNGDLYSNNPDVVMLFLAFDELIPEIAYGFHSFRDGTINHEVAAAISRVKQYLLEIRKNTSVPILLLNAPFRYLSPHGVFDAMYSHSHRAIIWELNTKLSLLCSTIADCIILDLHGIVSKIGEKNATDARQWYIAKQPFTFLCYHHLAVEIAKIIKTLFIAPMKCLILDCDNTLWGGILGEDGTEGVALGNYYPGNCYLDFQRFIKDLKNKGIFLALCSKNNENDVLDFIKNSSNMVLSLDDIATYRINWQDKASNILEISKELNIGLDSIVFVDDSDLECAWVKSQLPELSVIHLGANPSKYVASLHSTSYFDTRNITDEDLQRTEMFKGAKQSAINAESFDDYSDFLKSLDLKIEFSIDESKHIKRISQLTNKTNQFNFRTIRYSESQVREIINSEQFLTISAALKDKNTDYGIISVVILTLKDKVAFIDTFLMSCRALSRDVDRAMLSMTAKICYERGINLIEGEYIPTKKNIIIENWFEGSNFQKVENKDNSWIYKLDLQLEPTWPEHIQEVSIR